MTSVGVVRSTVTVTVDIGACGVRHAAMQYVNIINQPVVHML